MRPQPLRACRRRSRLSRSANCTMRSSTPKRPPGPRAVVAVERASCVEDCPTRPGSGGAPRSCGPPHAALGLPAAREPGGARWWLLAPPVITRVITPWMTLLSVDASERRIALAGTSAVTVDDAQDPQRRSTRERSSPPSDTTDRRQRPRSGIRTSRTPFARRSLDRGQRVVQLARCGRDVKGRRALTHRRR